MRKNRNLLLIPVIIAAVIMALPLLWMRPLRWTPTPTSHRICKKPPAASLAASWKICSERG